VWSVLLVPGWLMSDRTAVNYSNCSFTRIERHLHCCLQVCHVACFPD